MERGSREGGGGEEGGVEFGVEGAFAAVVEDLLGRSVVSKSGSAGSASIRARKRTDGEERRGREIERTNLEDQDDIAQRVVDGEDDHGGKEALPQGAEQVGRITGEPLL